MVDREKAGTRALLVVACALLAVALPGDARPARSDTVTITFLAGTTDQPAWQVLIPNFERVYPNITVQATYAPSATIDQIEVTELAAGSAPDLLTTQSGRGSTVSISALARAGDLAPMIHKPWTKRSLPLVTSLDKYGKALYAFEPGVSFEGMLTNDDLFKKLGLKVPQTFSQLLEVCRKARADGTVPVLVDGANAIHTEQFLVDLAVASVYGKDKHWAAELKAGTASFAATPGWHQALQEFIDMSSAGCFEPGVTGSASVSGPFAAGQGLMLAGLSTQKGVVDQASPEFSYSFHPFPGGTSANQTQTFVNLNSTLSVNAHSSAQNQAAAQTFIDFLARPKQDALYTQIRGGVTQYQFLKSQLPPFMSAMASVLAHGAYVINPVQATWGGGVGLALQQSQIGLLTGQTTIDGLLSAMDAAWKAGPS